MNNREIANTFLHIADALEIKGENIFRIRAYRTAAQNIETLPQNVEDICREDPSKLDEIPGIGKDLKGKIIEMVDTDQLKYYDDLMSEFPDGFLQMLDLSGLGPKKLKKLKDELGIANVNDLEEACKKGKLENLEGMGLKTQEKLLEAIKHFRKKEGRLLLPEADIIADEIIAYLKKNKIFKRTEKAGSLRRGTETVGDIDILATASDVSKAMDYFTEYSSAESVIVKGSTKSSISLKEGPQVDLRIVDEASFGAALMYFTGSKQHNINIRKQAKSKGYKVNEYGIFSVGKSGDRDKKLAGKTEEEVYKKLGMKWIPPELRESRGEIEAARKDALPKKLLKIKDIKGDLHMHTTSSDGHDSLEKMVAAAQKKGYKYIAVTDHSKYVRVAGGMDENQILKHAEKIKKLDKEMKGIKIFAGVEVDILKDGKLDLADYALKELDVVIAAVHSYFSLDKEKQTARVLKAMDNKYVNILAHPSGRLITTRSAIQIDFDSVFKKAVQKNITLEVNTHGDRIDLNDVGCIRAKELGAKIAINTDAHSVEQFDEIIYGVTTARRAWLEAEDVINTYTLSKLMKVLGRT